MNNPRVSISVPVYNAEKYLRQCLNSLVDQTLQDIEIIIVNDGSTDNSEIICREYLAKDSRIKLISKENGGLASARQAALEIANGVFFCACDADDWAETTMYEKMYLKAIESDADIVMCDYYSEYGNGVTKISCYGREIPSANDQIIDDVLNGRFPCSVWSKIYKRDVLNKYNISWETGINMGEDFLINLKVLQIPARYAYLPEPLYHYRRMPGEDSYTNRITLNSYNQLLRIQDWIENNFDNCKYKKGICHYLINIAFAGLRVDECMTAGYYKKTSIKRLKYGGLLREHSLKSLVVLWTKILGYRAGLLVYRIMYKSVYK